MCKFSDKNIIKSWIKNSSQWITAIRDEQIESRVLVTNQAIVDAITLLNPKTVLDIGCGEGWLSKTLCLKNIEAKGTDVASRLIEKAKEDGIGKFEVISYEQVAAGILTDRYDVIVCNFSLLGKESVEGIFSIAPRLLSEKGHFIIQTIHPLYACDGDIYKDGWREGSWEGFSCDFTDPAPWYFRTLESWDKLFSENGFEIVDRIEPKYPKAGEIASLILIGHISNKSIVS